MSEEVKTEEPKTEEKTTETDRDDLDQFLSEFNDSRPKPEPAATAPTGDNRYKAFIERKMIEEEEQETVRVVESYASLVKEASGNEDVPIEAIEGALLRRNLVDKDFRNVVSKHGENPEQVRRYMKLIAEDIVKPFIPIDPQVTESKEAVRAAAKTNKPEPVEDKFPSDEEVWAMDKKEFAQLQKDVQLGKR